MQPDREDSIFETIEVVADRHIELMKNDDNTHIEKLAREEEEYEDEEGTVPKESYALSREERNFHEREKIVNLLVDFDDGVEITKLITEYGLPPSKVYRLTHGKARLDGSDRPGPRTHLTLAEEWHLILCLQTLIEEKQLHITGKHISYLAGRIWQATHPNQTPPAFSEHWRSGFNARHPKHQLLAKHVSPQDLKKKEASTRENANHCLQSLKHYLTTMGTNGKMPAECVFAADEIDVSANDKGRGERGFAVGPAKPTHGAPNDTPHITCIPFTCFGGWCPLNAMIVAGHPTVDQRLTAQTPQLRYSGGEIIWDESGSSESNDKDGNLGSWSRALTLFADSIDRVNKGTSGISQLSTKGTSMSFEGTSGTSELPTKGTSKVLKKLLIVDGFAAHGDVDVNRKMKERGIEVFKIASNLTHLVQLNDHGRLNGKAQQLIRTAKADVAAQNGGRDLPLERRLVAIEKIIQSVWSEPNIIAAAKDLGFEYDTDFDHVWMTDESISRALDRMEAEHKFTMSASSEEDLIVLREKRVMLANSLISHGALPIECTEVLSKEAVQATARAMAAMENSQKGNSSVPRPRRVVVKPSPESQGHFKRGTSTLLTSEAYLIAGEKRRKVEEQRAKDVKKTEDKKEAEETRMLAVRQERQDFLLQALEEAAPDWHVNLDAYSHKIGPYMSGSKPIEWAIQVLLKSRPKQKPQPLLFDM